MPVGQEGSAWHTLPFRVYPSGQVLVGVASHLSVVPLRELPDGQVTDTSHLPAVALYVYPVGQLMAALCSHLSVEVL